MDCIWCIVTPFGNVRFWSKRSFDPAGHSDEREGLRHVLVECFQYFPLPVIIQQIAILCVDEPFPR